MKKTVSLLFVLGLIACGSASANEPDSLAKRPKNTLYVSVGSLGLWFTAGASYERKLMSADSKVFVDVFLRGTLGTYVTWEGGGPTQSLTVQSVFGKNQSHIEIGLGIASLFDKSDYESGVSNANYFGEPHPEKSEYRTIIPAATLGYRYQKPTGHFVFRSGVASPDGVYISVGVAF